MRRRLGESSGTDRELQGRLRLAARLGQFPDLSARACNLDFFRNLIVSCNILFVIIAVISILLRGLQRRGCVLCQ